jgi:hypothetical protein
MFRHERYGTKLWICTYKSSETMRKFFEILDQRGVLFKRFENNIMLYIVQTSDNTVYVQLYVLVYAIAMQLWTTRRVKIKI